MKVEKVKVEEEGGLKWNQRSVKRKKVFHDLPKPLKKNFGDY